MLQVACEQHCSHTAVTKLAGDRVAVSENSSKPNEISGGHGCGFEEHRAWRETIYCAAAGEMSVQRCAHAEE